ncbi:MAG: TraB/GumN family protein [Flavobacteriales bacterium]|nr:TraB/GumN family protein [Flavobacteriales bacterium]
MIRFFLLFLIIIQSCQIYGQLERSALLWKIEKTDSTKESYIFGTIHLIDESKFFFPKTLDKSVRKIDRLFFEIDIEKSLDFDVMLSMMDKALLPEGTTLKQLMSQEQYLTLEKRLQEKGLPISLFDKIKPMFIQSLLGSGSESSDLSNGKSYEIELLKLAKSKNIKTDGLETADFQMSLFDSIPLQDQTDYLLSSLNDSAQLETIDVGRMIDLYTQQHIDSLYHFMIDDEGLIAKFEDILIEKRNRSWIPKIESAIKKERCLFAVGAGHLGGPIGVIDLLIKSGYVLTPITD